MEDDKFNIFRDPQEVILDTARTSDWVLPEAFRVKKSKEDTNAVITQPEPMLLNVRMEYDEKSRCYTISLPRRRDRVGAEFIASPNGSFLMEEEDLQDEDRNMARSLDVYASTVIAAGVCASSKLSRSVVINAELDALQVMSASGTEPDSEVNVCSIVVQMPSVDAAHNLVAHVHHASGGIKANKGRVLGKS